LNIIIVINKYIFFFRTGLCKLGKHIEGRDGSWKIILTNTSLPMFQCPICDTFLISPESRMKHEVEKHSLLLESIHKYVDMVSNPENTACTQQISILNYLKICETSKYNTTVVETLAKRTNLLKSFKFLGPKIIDFRKCKYCP